MDRWQYLIVLGACLLITAPLEIFGSGGVYRQPMRLLRSVGPVALVFVIWDAIAIAGHVWTYNPPLHQRGGARRFRDPAGGAAVLRGDPDLRPADLLGGERDPRLCAWSPMSGLGYTLPAVVALIAVIALELAVLRTGLFGKVEYWISMGIVVAFQVIVDGWLTKLSAPIVIYNEQHTSGVRFPWDIPVEDFVFGWAMVTAVLLLWEKQRPKNGRQR